MTDEELNALAGEAATILTNAGATMVRVERVGEGWLVAAHGFGSGCASDNPDEWRPGAFSDPRELARHLVSAAPAPLAINEDGCDVALPSETVLPPPPVDAYDSETEEIAPSTPENAAETMVDPPIWPENPGEGDQPVDADATDAEFVEIAAEITDLGDGSFLIENHPDDVAVEEPEAAPPQDRFYGLDDLDRRRSLRIGDVVRIGASKYSLDEYATVQGIVVRETVDGVYGGPADVYERFVALSAVQSAQAAKVAFLLTATREEIEAFDPESGWPK